MVGRMLSLQSIHLSLIFATFANLFFYISKNIHSQGIRNDGKFLTWRHIISILEIKTLITNWRDTQIKKYCTTRRLFTLCRIDTNNIELRVICTLTLKCPFFSEVCMNHGYSLMCYIYNNSCCGLCTYVIYLYYSLIDKIFMTFILKCTERFVQL